MVRTDDLQRAVEYRKVCEQLERLKCRKEELEAMLFRAVPRPLLGPLLGLSEEETEALDGFVKARELRQMGLAATLRDFTVDTSWKDAEDKEGA